MAYCGKVIALTRTSHEYLLRRPIFSPCGLRASVSSASLRHSWIFRVIRIARKPHAWS